MATSTEARATAAALIGVAAVAGYVVLSIVLGAGFAIPTAIVGSVMGMITLKGPLGQAIARRLDAESAGAALPEETAAELEDMRERMVELEERLDFTERMLAQSRQPQALDRER